MRLGLTSRQLGNVSEATADLEPGIQLLPTATALNALADVRRVRAAVSDAQIAESAQLRSRRCLPDSDDCGNYLIFARHCLAKLNPPAGE